MKEKNKIIYYSTLSVLIICSGLSIGYSLFTSKEYFKKEPVVNVQEEVTQNNTEETSTIQSQDEPIAEDNEALPNFWDFESKSTVKEYSVEVDWLVEPMKINFTDLPFEFNTETFEIKKVGTVKNGELAGEGAYLVYVHDMGQSVNLFVLTPTSATNIEKWIPEISKLPEAVTLIENNTVLHKTNGAITTMERIREWSTENGVDIKNFKTKPDSGIKGDTVYRYENCFFALTSSGMVVEYTLDPPFASVEDGGNPYSTPRISFTERGSKKKFSAEYKIRGSVAYGCGSLCAPLAYSDKTMSDLVEVGTTETGDTLYALKDTKDTVLKEMYENKNTRPYLNTENDAYELLENSKYTYTEFLALYPLLFWQDPFGRIAEFKNTEFEVLAEKCKPVIYLYPEEETNLSVWVKPNVGFTKTIPSYNSGWQVRAYPDGTIIDKATGVTYPYLYWAGLVSDYPPIHEGWSVAREDVEKFLNEKLSLLGLTKKEIADFNEYWVAHLSTSPYYLLSFVNQDVIDTLSPLTLDKQPDTIIRVLLTAQAIQKPVEIKPQHFGQTPERKGFVVAEWGGVVLP